MPVLKTISRFILIAVLCFAMVNLHGFAAAAHFEAEHQCPSIVQPDHDGLRKAVHPGPCCTKIHCCPILEVLPSGNMYGVPQAPRPQLAEAEPFLLVRALYPPPKPQFS